MNRFSTALALCALGASAQFCAWAGPLQVSVLDKEGKPVPDAVVVLVPAPGAAPKSALPMQATVNQEKMRFQPAVSLVAVGAKVRFVNNDPWEHHVRASAAGAREFENAATGGFEMLLDGKAEGKSAKAGDAVFSKPGAVLLGCHLHGSMRGHVYVSDSPWAAVTGPDGTARFEGVPDGAAQVRVWHADQFVDLAPQSVALTAAPAQATMQLSVVPRRRRA